MSEYEIGEIIECEDGSILKVQEADDPVTCEGCYFRNKKTHVCSRMGCLKQEYRPAIIFRKIGESITCPGAVKTEELLRSSNVSEYARIGHETGKLVQEKQDAYGDSFSKSGEFLQLLFPDGVPPEKYTDALTLIRIFDKCMRIATQKDAFNESPYRDIVGYGLLGVQKDEQEGNDG